MPPTSLLARLLERLSFLQTKRPRLVILLVLATLIPTGFAASTLTLRTSFTELLPDSKPSVIEMRRAQTRLASTSTLTVVAIGDDVAHLKRFVDEVAPKLRSLPRDLVANVDDGTRDARQFLEAHKHLYADLEDIQRAHDEVIERYDHEVGKRSGMDLGLDDEEDAPTRLDIDAIEQRFRKKADEARDAEPGVDGYYIGIGDYFCTAGESPVRHEVLHDLNGVGISNLDSGNFVKGHGVPKTN
jgi:predicted RND superfamily exporter protein